MSESHVTTDVMQPNVRTLMVKLTQNSLTTVNSANGVHTTFFIQ